MDAINRHLRDAVGSSSGSSAARASAPGRPFVLVCEDQVACLGGRDVMHRVRLHACVQPYSSASLLPTR